jgi:hypothetical protein
MTRKQRKMLDELQARAGCRFESVELTGSGHLRIRLHTGRFVVTGGTPSDSRAFLNCVAQIKRTLREGA